MLRVHNEMLPLMLLFRKQQQNVIRFLFPVACSFANWNWSAYQLHELPDLCELSLLRTHQQWTGCSWKH